MDRKHVIAGMLAAFVMAVAASSLGAQPPVAARPAEKAEQVQLHIRMLDQVADLVSSPRLVVIVALNALKDEMGLKAEALAGKLELLLKNARSLTVRNALRLALKDLYKDMGQTEKAAEQLMALILDNDEAIAEDEDDDEDEEAEEDEDEDEDE